MIYQSVIILGIDQFAAFCAKKVDTFGYSAQVIDINDSPSSMLLSSCNRLGVQYRFFKRAERTDYLLNVKRNLLLISANNPWIIPDIILKEDGVKAVNLHHALLPLHPGRNAEAWAIFEGDAETGITWHFVSSAIDAGDIIIQEKIRIDDDMTSRKLLKIQNQLAKDTFDKICEGILNNSVKACPQSASHHKIHYSWEVPNNGYLKPEWESPKISRFLRAMDYGMLKTLGDPKITIQNKLYTWVAYEIHDNTGTDDNGTGINGNNIIIVKSDKIFLLKNIHNSGMKD